uniref:F-box domain-containing protein n=1 Tax=Culex tarsalis TaxID=7177 RepID=A0A1Q3EV98_CULTA
MSRPDSCASCDRMIFRHTVTCGGPCGQAFHLTCTSLKPETDPATFDELTWLCDGCRLFQQLPPEVWTEIFEQLDVPDLLKIRLTSRAWKQLVDESPTLRGRLSVRIEDDHRLNYDPVLPPASKVSITVVEIEEVSSWWPTFGAKLVSVELNECLISLATLLEMLRQAPLLKELALYGVIRADYDVRDMAGANFRLDNLEKLALRECDEWKFLPTLVKMFAKMCPRLKFLSVRENSNRKALIRLVRAVQGTLRGIKFDATVKVLEALTKLDKLQLKHVTILSVIKFNLDAFVKFFTAQPSIEYLCICPEAIQLLSEQAFAQLKLVSLKVELLNDFNLNLGTMPTLKHLEITAMGFNQPALTFDDRTQTPSLLEFRLFGTQLVGNSLANFLAACPHLKLLRLAYIHASSSHGFGSLAQPFNAVKTLKLEETELPRPLLLNLLRLCRNVDSLELLSVPEVQCDVVRGIMKRFPALKRLTLDCEEPNAAAKCIIKYHGPDLRRLDLKERTRGSVSAGTKARLLEHFAPWCRVRFRWSEPEVYGQDLMKF